MSLVNLSAVVQDAHRNDYAVPAFNFWTFDDVRTIIRTADALHSPVVVMLSLSGVANLGYKLAYEMVADLAASVQIPVVLHLDHAETVQDCFSALRYGFTSVMYDGSKLDFDENVRQTCKVVEVAHAIGASVEAEIGRVGRGEEGEEGIQVLTDSNDAKNFFDATQVDALAIAVGTQHGMQKQQAEIRFDIIDKISKVVDVPLVLHGSSGVKNEDLPKITKTGIAKVNVGTKLRDTFVASCRDILTNDLSIRNHLSVFKKVSERVSVIVADKIERLGSKGKG